MKKKIGKIIFTLGSLIIFFGFFGQFFLLLIFKRHDYFETLAWSVTIGVSFLILGSFLEGFMETKKPRSSFDLMKVLWIVTIIVGLFILISLIIWAYSFT